jgi:putative peptidoglycan lipid II flippase
MSEPIVRALYERGAFTAADTVVVARTLAVFGLGLPAFVLIKAFTPGYFAREDTRTPMAFATLSVAVNIVTALILFPRLGAPGIAAASVAAGWVNALLLFAVLMRRGHWTSDRALLSRLPRLALAAAGMGLGLWYALPFFEPMLGHGTHLGEHALGLAILVAGGTVLYFALVFLLGAADPAMLRRAVRRGEKMPG